MSLTRVGAARQAVSRGLVVTGADPERIARALTGVPLPRLGGVPLTVAPQERTAGLLLLSSPLTWMGGPDARDEAFAALGQATAQLAGAARSSGGRLLPTAVTLGDAPPVLGGDLHELEVLDASEQEVLCNVLRRYVPVLIALSGRGVVGTGAPVDRVGSRRLIESTEHLATRYLASTSPRHLEHVRAELRRGGLARLEQMDVAPVVHPDGTRTVLVRCMDAQASLAVTRAHAVLLCALALHARRLVRDGRREGHVSQRLLEENRARAIADGMRASLGVDAARPGKQQGGRPGNAGRDAAAEPQRRRALLAARDLLTERRAEIGNIDATAAELAPLLMMIDLPGLGVPFRRADDVLRGWAAGGPAVLEAKLLESLCDGGVGGTGGTVVGELRAAHPGKIGLILESWRTALSAPPPQPRNTRKPPNRSKGGSGRGGSAQNRGGSGQNRGGAGRGKGGAGQRRGGHGQGGSGQGRGGGQG
ncbi:hypothetical protein SAMN05443665_104150 [Actinomadura meyerae]|uniref:Uncharacterized protein n=1 Tax=Actinomadura meyerae TaxID=240840 RepID=A0A239NHZ8_9ACTN|nr:hypothetical protein [Actinomadura meyerae]SNT54172.1 hypothetical protein SAMN05443665_104150 [Actinomadura meyerae]